MSNLLFIVLLNIRFIQFLSFFFLRFIIWDRLLFNWRFFNGLIFFRCFIWRCLWFLFYAVFLALIFILFFMVIMIIDGFIVYAFLDDILWLLLIMTIFKTFYFLFMRFMIINMLLLRFAFYVRLGFLYLKLRCITFNLLFIFYLWYFFWSSIRFFTLLFI